MTSCPRRPRLLPASSVLLMAAALGCAPSATTHELSLTAPAVAPASLAAAPVARDDASAEAPSIALPYDLATLDLKSIFEMLGDDAIIWYQHVQTLANPYFEGRVNASAGTERARDYMEFYFRMYGLQPAFPGDSGTASSYRQLFEFEGSPRIEVTVDNARAEVDGRDLVENEEFVILGNSESGEVSGPLTFVGYGIESDEFNYSSFDEDTDLTGRIAVLLRYEPVSLEGTSRWAEENFSRAASIARKMRTVQRRNAAGIILVNPPGVQDGAEGLETPGSSARFSMRGSQGIPVMQLTTEVADDLLQEADPQGRDLMTWRRLADIGEVKSVDLDDSVRIAFGADVERRREVQMVDAANVAAVLPGKGSFADEWVVIGGHYDHNGYGLFGTTPDAGELFPGADDNASGTAGMLVLAKKLSELYAQEEGDLRSVLFIAFDAEERGLHGSRFFADNPTIAPDRMTALLNMDMIGRLRNDTLSVLGVGTGEGIEQIIGSHADEAELQLSMVTGGSGRSDDANFHRIGVPAVHFFTDMHPEYTTPADKAYTVNPIGAAKIIELVYGTAVDLATRGGMIAYSEAGPRRGADRGYAPVRLGIQPGMGADSGEGILIESVFLGTSAADAGLEAGDVMVAWDGEPLVETRDLFEQLQAHKPGDTVKVTYLREGETKEVDLTLKASERATE